LFEVYSDSLSFGKFRVLTMEDFTGKNVLVVSDIHYSHRNIIKHCGRPCDCDKRMVRAFQDVRLAPMASPVDAILNLGDFSFGNKEECVDGYKLLFTQNGYPDPILIVGNHDQKYKRVLKLPWSKIIHPQHQPYKFVYDGLVFAAQHRNYQEFPRKVKPGRWLLQKITDLFLDIHDRKRLGSFLNYQDIPKNVQVCLHGHIHEVGQRYDWIDNTLIVNCCVEQWDYRPTSLEELAQEYRARKDYYERKR